MAINLEKERIQLVEVVETSEVTEVYVKLNISQEEAQEYLDKWQKKLRLTDWDITLILCDDISKQYFNSSEKFVVYASIETNETMKKAKVKVATNFSVVKGEFEEDTQVYRDFLEQQIEGAEDVEYNILHELLHLLVVNPYDTSPEAFSSLLTEQSINILAQALVDLDRKKGVTYV